MSNKKVLKIVILIFIIIAVIIIAQNHEFINILRRPRMLKHYIKGFGLFAPVIFITLYSLRTLMFVFPISIFAIISGSLFGFGFGFLYSMVGAFLSATVAFCISRYFAKDLFNKYLKEKIKLLKGKSDKGFRIIFFLRVIMIMPFDALSYAVGVTKISYRDFIFGTLLGIAPEFLIYSYLGYIGVSSDISFKEKIIISSVLLSIILIGHILKKFFIKEKPKSNE